MKISAISRAQAHTVGCPACGSPPGKPCTQPTDKRRTAVAWVHLAREGAYLDEESKRA